MILKHTAIGCFHGLLSDKVKRSLGYVLNMPDPPGTTDWTRIGPRPNPDHKIVFRMASYDGRILYRTTRNNNGEQTPVFPLFSDKQDEPTLWLSWSDEWHPLGDRRFHLISAGWTFYWGNPADDKQQLFRAEWDVPSSGARGELAPQPHWHLDGELLTTLYPEAMTRYAVHASEAQGLQEIESDVAEHELRELTPKCTQRTIGLAKLHLGMAGWWHAEQSPNCWQLRIKKENDVVAWATKLLEQAKREFTHLRPGMPEVM